MKIELHLLQNFAPSNLNRDDTGAPKDCEFGGYRRARISSQSQKRAVRQLFDVGGLVGEDNRGTRTKRLIQNVAETLQRDHNVAESDSVTLAVGAIEGVGLGRGGKSLAGDDLKTQYLLFVPKRIIGEIAALLAKHRSALLSPTAPDAGAGEADKPTKKGGQRNAKKAAEDAYPKELRKELTALLASAARTVDVALFGRMIADKSEWNIDASCQVAHAISTNRVQMDFDFFTAVDDLKPKDTAGSDMMGTVQFNSSCFYRYAVLDAQSLEKNLEGDSQLVQRAVSAFVRAFVSAIPSGKQNSMAAHNFPSYVLAVVRNAGQPLSLANAFLKPARPRGEDVDLVDDSIGKLEDYAARMQSVLGEAACVAWADRDLEAGKDKPARTGRIDDFYREVGQRAFGANA